MIIDNEVLGLGKTKPTAYQIKKIKQGKNTNRRKVSSWATLNTNCNFISTPISNLNDLIFKITRDCLSFILHWHIFSLRFLSKEISFYVLSLFLRWVMLKPSQLGTVLLPSFLQKMSGQVVQTHSLKPKSDD